PQFQGGASRLAALLLPQICPISSVVAPCCPGAALRHLCKSSRLQGTSEHGANRSHPSTREDPALDAYRDHAEPGFGSAKLVARCHRFFSGRIDTWRCASHAIWTEPSLTWTRRCSARRNDCSARMSRCAHSPVTASNPPKTSRVT